MGGRRDRFWGATFKLSIAVESYRLRQSDYGYLARGYLPCSLETKAAGRRQMDCFVPPVGLVYGLKPHLQTVSSGTSLRESPERVQLWKSRPTNVRGLWEWVCHRLSCSVCCTVCVSCFLSPLLSSQTFVLSSSCTWGFMGVWNDKSRRNLGEL